MSFIKKCLKKSIGLLSNNIVLNNIIILLRLDDKIHKSKNPYLSFKPLQSKSTQENAGYSNRPEINEVITKSKQDLLNAVLKYCNANDRILDIGCGPGMYLELFKERDFSLLATDINEEMLVYAKKNVPLATTFHGNFLKISIPEKVNFVYCIGVLIYIGRNDIVAFFKKIYGNLTPNGILYLNYPHAISLGDVLYNDLTYIQYSPKVIEKLIAPYFEIVVHHHAFDGRKVAWFDKKPYKSLNPDTDRTYKNSYLLIAKKKR